MINRKRPVLHFIYTHIQGVIKMLLLISRVSSAYKNRGKKRSYQQTSGKIKFNDKYTMQCVTNNWHSTCTVHLSNLITVQLLLFINSQFTTNAQYVLHLSQCTHGHVWSWTVAPFQRSRGGCKWFDRHENCVGEVSLSCSRSWIHYGF